MEKSAILGKKLELEKEHIIMAKGAATSNMTAEELVAALMQKQEAQYKSIIEGVIKAHEKLEKAIEAHDQFIKAIFDDSDVDSIIKSHLSGERETVAEAKTRLEVANEARRTRIDNLLAKDKTKRGLQGMNLRGIRDFLAASTPVEQDLKMAEKTDMAALRRAFNSIKEYLGRIGALQGNQSPNDSVDELVQALLGLRADYNVWREERLTEIKRSLQEAIDKIAASVGKNPSGTTTGGTTGTSGTAAP